MADHIQRFSKMEDLTKALEAMTSKQVMVGVPAEEALRKPEAGEKTPINNAALAYIHEHGCPAAHIPARPFLRPGIEKIRDKIKERLWAVGKIALKGDDVAVDKGFHALGLVAQNAVRAEINRGVPPPLADSTLRGRARRGRKGAIKELKRRAALGGDVSETALLEGISNAKPLIDTAQLRNALTYVIRQTK
jgi:hypothetical protein